MSRLFLLLVLPYKASLLRDVDQRPFFDRFEQSFRRTSCMPQNKYFRPSYG